MDKLDFKRKFEQNLAKMVRLKINNPNPGDVIGHKGTYDWKCVAYLERNFKK